MFTIIGRLNKNGIMEKGNPKPRSPLALMQ